MRWLSGQHVEVVHVLPSIKEAYQCHGPSLKKKYALSAFCLFNIFTLYSIVFIFSSPFIPSSSNSNQCLRYVLKSTNNVLYVLFFLSSCGSHVLPDVTQQHSSSNNLARAIPSYGLVLLPAGPLRPPVHNTNMVSFMIENIPLNELI